MNLKQENNYEKFKQDVDMWIEDTQYWINSCSEFDAGMQRIYSPCSLSVICDKEHTYELLMGQKLLWICIIGCSMILMILLKNIQFCIQNHLVMKNY